MNANVARPPAGAADERLRPLLLSLLIGAAPVVVPVAVEAQVPAQLPVPMPSQVPSPGREPVIELTPEARLARIERMLNEQSLSDLVLQLQQLQQEVQDLRGQVEMHQYRLQRLQPGLRFGGFDPAGPAALAPPAGLDGAADDGAPGGLGPGAGGTAGIEAGTGSGAGLGGSDDGSPSLDGARPGGPPVVGMPRLNPPPPGSGLLGLPSPETMTGSERDAYRDAFDLLKDRDYDGARDAFGELLIRYPSGQFADNARYWLGEIGYVSEDYDTAKAQFNRLIADYPLSPKVPGAMLKLGYVYDEEGETAEARKLLQQVVERFPDTTEARLAQGRLERLGRDGG